MQSYSSFTPKSHGRNTLRCLALSFRYLQSMPLNNENQLHEIDSFPRGMLFFPLRIPGPNCSPRGDGDETVLSNCVRVCVIVPFVAALELLS